ncbi:MAG: hypothetical protein IPQ16_02345 [Geobacteraceae bacterium]|nr:hypothetical protein [Geobacteraceae bacterium]
MDTRLLKNLKKFAAACPLLISAFIITPVPAAHAEALFLFRSPESALPARGDEARLIQQKFLKLDEKGDLLIQCGCARFTVAYNDPADRFKPSHQQQHPQQEQPSGINGISLTASLSF